MKNNVIGFVGIDNFDNILYLSRILLKLGKKVLMIDHSESNSLMYSIPKPSDSCSNKEIITYRRVDFTCMPLCKEMLEEYEDILINFGCNKSQEDMFQCSRIIFTTDLFVHHQERVTDLIRYLSDEIHKELLIKDVIEVKITPDHVLDRMEHLIPKEEVSILYRDELDYENSLLIHNNGIVRFYRLSRQRRNYLISEIKRFHPNLNQKQINHAYRQAKRGD